MYKLTGENWVLRLIDQARIPTTDDPLEPNTNPHYLAYKEWLAAGNTPEAAEIDPVYEQQRLTDALNRHMDATAGQRRYDNRFTCSLRAGFAGPFQAEGLAFAAWMDQCNIAAYTILAECKAGVRPIPSEAELIAAMPEIEWPPSPVPEGAA